MNRKPGITENHEDVKEKMHLKKNQYQTKDGSLLFSKYFSPNEEMRTLPENEAQEKTPESQVLHFPQEVSNTSEGQGMIFDSDSSSRVVSNQIAQTHDQHFSTSKDDNGGRPTPIRQGDTREPRVADGPSDDRLPGAGDAQSDRSEALREGAAEGTIVELAHEVEGLDLTGIPEIDIAPGVGMGAINLSPPPPLPKSRSEFMPGPLRLGSPTNRQKPQPRTSPQGSLGAPQMDVDFEVNEVWREPPQSSEAESNDAGRQQQTETATGTGGTGASHPPGRDRLRSNSGERYEDMEHFPSWLDASFPEEWLAEEDISLNAQDHMGYTGALEAYYGLTPGSQGNQPKSSPRPIQNETQNGGLGNNSSENEGISKNPFPMQLRRASRPTRKMHNESPLDPLSLMGAVSRKGLLGLQTQPALKKASPALLAHFLKTCKGEVDAASAMYLSFAEEYRDLASTMRRVSLRAQQDDYRSSLDRPNEEGASVLPQSASEGEPLDQELSAQGRKGSAAESVFHRQRSHSAEYRCPEFPTFEADPELCNDQTAEYEVVLDAEKLGMTVENVLERTIVRTVGPDSAAGQAGVEKGSLLVGLGGKSTAALSHFEILEGLRHAERPLHLRFRRLNPQRLQIRRAEMRGLIHPHDWLGGLGSESALAGSPDGRVTDVMVAFVEERMLALMRLLCVGQDLLAGEVIALEEALEGSRGHRKTLTGESASSEGAAFSNKALLEIAAADPSTDALSPLMSTVSEENSRASSFDGSNSMNLLLSEKAKSQSANHRKKPSWYSDSEKSHMRSGSQSSSSHIETIHSVAFLVVLAEFHRSLERIRRAGTPQERVACMGHSIAQLLEVFDWQSEVVRAVTQDLRDLLCLLLDVNGDADADKEDNHCPLNCTAIERPAFGRPPAPLTNGHIVPSKCIAKGAVSMMLQQLILHLSQEQLELQIIPLVHRLAVSSLSSRLACCSLVPLVYARLPLPKQLQLRGVLSRFVHDVAPSVRKSSTLTLIKVSSVADPSAISWLMLLCERACLDKDAWVRNAALDTCVHFLSILPQRLKVQSSVGSTNSRHGQSLICEPSTPTRDKHKELDSFQFLEEDFADERSPKNRPSSADFSSTTPSNAPFPVPISGQLESSEERSIKSKIYSMISNVSEDPAWQVRAGVAWRADSLCMGLGPDWAAVVVDILQALLKDSDRAVKVEALKTLPRLARLLLAFAEEALLQQVNSTGPSQLTLEGLSPKSMSVQTDLTTDATSSCYGPPQLGSSSFARFTPRPASVSGSPPLRSPSFLSSPRIYPLKRKLSKDSSRKSTFSSDADRNSEGKACTEDEELFEGWARAHTKILDILVPTATKVADEEAKSPIEVLCALATSLGDLLWVLDSGGTELLMLHKKISENVLPTVLNLLQHKDPQVCCAMLYGLGCVEVSSPNEAEGRYKRLFTDPQLQDITMVLQVLKEDRNWRVREASAHTIPALVSTSPTVGARRELALLAEHLLSDCVDRVRQTAAKAACQAAQADIIQSRWIQQYGQEIALLDESRSSSHTKNLHQDNQNSNTPPITEAAARSIGQAMEQIKEPEETSAADSESSPEPAKETCDPDSESHTQDAQSSPNSRIEEEQEEQQEKGVGAVNLKMENIQNEDSAAQPQSQDDFVAEETSPPKIEIKTNQVLESDQKLYQPTPAPPRRPSLSPKKQHREISNGAFFQPEQLPQSGLQPKIDSLALGSAFSAENTPNSFPQRLPAAVAPSKSGTPPKDQTKPSLKSTSSSKADFTAEEDCTPADKSIVKSNQAENGSGSIVPAAAGWGSWLVAHVFPLMRLCCDSRNFQQRLLCTYMAEVLVHLDVITIVQLQIEVLPMFSKISKDGIPNVRIALARVIGSLCIGLVDAAIRQDLSRILDVLLEDIDTDVKYFAREAKKRMIDSEVRHH